MATAGRRWVVLHRGAYYGRASTLAAAQALARRPYRLNGYVRAYNERSGEEWERRDFIWFKTERLAPESATARAAQSLEVTGSVRLMQILAQGAGEALQAPMGKARQAFHDFRIEGRDLAEALKDPTELLPKMAEGFTALNDEGRRGNAVIALREMAGRGNVKLIAVLTSSKRLEISSSRIFTTTRAKIIALTFRRFAESAKCLKPGMRGVWR